MVAIEPSPEIQGLRVQLLQTLQCLSRGDVFLCRIKDDALPKEIRFLRWDHPYILSWKRDPNNWTVQTVVPTWVPGTIAPVLIGKKLIELGWCAPSKNEHWCTHLKAFHLTEQGILAHQRGEEWWNSLPLRKKLWLRIKE